MQLTSLSQAVVWNAVYTPFGVSAVTGTLATQSLRLPGQYYDPETGMNHNGFRDYSGATTRYVESDPIGLGGGMNTFQYVSGNPFKFTDPMGLAAAASGGSYVCGWHDMFRCAAPKANCNPNDLKCSSEEDMNDELYTLMSDIPGMRYVADNPQKGAAWMIAGGITVATLGVGDLAVVGADTFGDWLLSEDGDIFWSTGYKAWTGYAFGSVISDEFGNEFASGGMSALAGAPRDNPYLMTLKLTLKTNPLY